MDPQKKVLEFTRDQFACTSLTFAPGKDLKNIETILVSLIFWGRQING